MIKKVLKLIFRIGLYILAIANGLLIAIITLSIIFPTQDNTDIYFGTKILCLIEAVLLFLIIKPIEDWKIFNREIGIHQNGLQFAGFKRRFAAFIIDGAIYSPILVVPYFISNLDMTKTAIILIIQNTIYYPYVIYFTFKYGQTIGKMAFSIKVFTIDGDKVNLKNAVLRSSADLFISAVYFAQNIYGFIKFGSGWFIGKTFNEIIEGIYYSNIYYNYFGLLILVYISLDYFVILINNEKMAIHDFIGKTVVLCIKNKNAS